MHECKCKVVRFSFDKYALKENIILINIYGNQCIREQRSGWAGPWIQFPQAPTVWGMCGCTMQKKLWVLNGCRFDSENTCWCRVGVGVLLVGAGQVCVNIRVGAGQTGQLFP